MIAKNVNMYCNEDISHIENYAIAIADDTVWEVHHRFETHDADGKILSSQISSEELKKQNLYYDRPASELIFLSEKNHKHLHMLGNKYAEGKNLGNQYAKGNVLSEETRKQMGKSRLGNANNGIRFIKCLETGEVHRTLEWVKLGYKGAYLVAKHEHKTCRGLHFEYINED